MSESQPHPRIRPVSPVRLVQELVDVIAGMPGPTRVAIDGASATGADELAASLVDPLRARGRLALHVSARFFLRPASLRLERGRTDPDAFYEDWLDVPALLREVLDPLEQGGSRRVLPALWDPETDRATRAGYLRLPDDAVVLVGGALLLGHWLPFDLTVHLSMSPAALARRTPPGWAWTLPAYARYAEEVVPIEVADLVVRVDDPRHPALAEPG